LIAHLPYTPATVHSCTHTKNGTHIGQNDNCHHHHRNTNGKQATTRTKPMYEPPPTATPMTATVPYSLLPPSKQYLPARWRLEHAALLHLYSQLWQSLLTTTTTTPMMTKSLVCAATATANSEAMRLLSMPLPQDLSVAAWSLDSNGAMVLDSCSWMEHLTSTRVTISDRNDVGCIRRLKALLLAAAEMS